MDKKKKRYFRTKRPCREKKTNSLADKVATLMYQFGKNPERTIESLSVSDLLLLLGQEGKISEDDYEKVFNAYLSKASIRSLIKFAERLGNKDKRDRILKSITSKKSFEDGSLLFLNAKQFENKKKGIEMMKNVSYSSFIDCLERVICQHHVYVFLRDGKLEGTFKKKLLDCRSEWQKIRKFQKIIDISSKDSTNIIRILNSILNPNESYLKLQ